MPGRTAFFVSATPFGAFDTAFVSVAISFGVPGTSFAASDSRFDASVIPFLSLYGHLRAPNGHILQDYPLIPRRNDNHIET